MLMYTVLPAVYLLAKKIFIVQPFSAHTRQKINEQIIQKILCAETTARNLFIHITQFFILPCNSRGQIYFNATNPPIHP